MEISFEMIPEKKKASQTTLEGWEEWYAPNFFAIELLLGLPKKHIRNVCAVLKKNKTMSSSLQPTVKLLEHLTFHQLVVTIQL